MRRRAQAGQNWLRIFFVGDTDEVPKTRGVEATTEVFDEFDEFDQSPGAVFKAAISGGVSLPWNLALAALIGLSLLFTRITLGVDCNMAHAHHVIGSLVLTVVSIAAAEVARPVRYLNMVLGAALMAAPFMFTAGITATIASVVLGIGLIALSLRRGLIRERYGNWDRLII